MLKLQNCMKAMLGAENCTMTFSDSRPHSMHPSAEILITLWRYYHEQTTNHMKLWLKVGCSDQKKLTFPDGEFC